MDRTRYKFHEEHFPYFITSSLLEELPMFTKHQVAQIMLDQLVFLQRECGVTLCAFVIMAKLLVSSVRN